MQTESCFLLLQLKRFTAALAGAEVAVAFKLSVALFHGGVCLIAGSLA